MFEDITSSILNRLLKPPRKLPMPGIVIGRTGGADGAEVTFPDKHRTQHLVIVGKTGFGKTHALELITLQAAGRGEGLAFFDFHGDASMSLIRRLLIDPEATRKLVVLDPSDEHRSPGINVLESGPTESDRFRKVAELSSILRQRWGVDSFGARTEELLRNSLYTLTVCQRTLADLPQFLTDDVFRSGLISELDHPTVQAYWRERYEPLSEGMKAAFREPLLNRVTAFLTEPGARHLLGQRQSTIDMAAVMRQQQWLIIRLPKGRLREHAHTIGNLIFAQIHFAAMEREMLPLRERKTFTLVCDEVQNLAENDLGSLIAEGRKFGISIITANQFWEQLPRELRGALLSAGSHMLFRLSHSDAGVLASELDAEHGRRLSIKLSNLERGEVVGRFGSGQLQAFRVSGLPVPPRLNASAFEDVVRKVTHPRVEIERDLRSRSQAESLAESSPATAVPPPAKEGQDGW